MSAVWFSFGILALIPVVLLIKVFIFHEPVPAPDGEPRDAAACARPLPPGRPKQMAGPETQRRRGVGGRARGGREQAAFGINGNGPPGWKPGAYLGTRIRNYARGRSIRSAVHKKDEDARRTDRLTDVRTEVRTGAVGRGGGRARARGGERGNAPRRDIGPRVLHLSD